MADPSGRYKVESVYRHGPADYEYVKLAPGDFVLAVDGHELKSSDNYWQLFASLPGRTIRFLINSKPDSAGAWTISVEPLTATQQNGFGIPLVGRKPEGDGGQADKWADRLSAHSSNGCAVAIEIPGRSHRKPR